MTGIRTRAEWPAHDAQTAAQGCRDRGPGLDRFHCGV
jgi:hypothetical protein